MIKLFAMIFMLMDHFALILLPENGLCAVLRLAGRLSMPLYAYGIARGCFFSMKHKSMYRYLRNLFLLAIISQLPYAMMYRGGLLENGLNVCCTWILSVVFIGVFLNKEIWESYDKKFLAGLAFGWVLLVLYLNHMWGLDYEIYGVVVPIIFYMCYLKCFRGQAKEPPYYTTLLLALLWFGYNYLESDGLQLPQVLMIFSVPVISILSPIDKKIKIPKWLGYACYPLSMIPFIIIREII